MRYEKNTYNGKATMRLLIIALMLSIVGCGQESDSGSNCKTYISPYEVEFPDNSIRKSDVSACQYPFGLTLLKATDLSQGRESFTAQKLTIRLIDVYTSSPYLTTFADQ